MLASAGAKYCSVWLACAARPWMLCASPRMKPSSPLRAGPFSASNSWSRPTGEYAFCGGIDPPLGIGGSTSEVGSSTTYLFATPEREFSKIRATVPCRIGASLESRLIVTSAPPSETSVIELTVPTGAGPMNTWLPATSPPAS